MKKGRSKGRIAPSKNTAAKSRLIHKVEPAPLRARVAGTLERIVSHRWFLPAVLVLGALLRLAHVLALRATPWFENLDIDPQIYDEWAARIADGSWIGDKIFYQDPLYPYFLAVFYKIFGRDLLLVRLVQAGFGVGTCWLTAILGRRLFGMLQGNLAGLLAALFAPLIFYDAEIEKTFLSVFLVAAFMVLALRRARLSRFLAGLLLALASLTRSNLLFFIPLGAAALILERQSDAADPSADVRRLGPLELKSIAMAAAFFCGALLVLGPVVLRNRVVGGEWVLTTSQAGQNFYLGNNPKNNTGGYVALPFQRANPMFEQDDFRAEAEARVGHKLTSSKISSFWFKEGWKEIRREPAWAGKLLLRKFAVFWNDYEVPDNKDMYFLARDSWVLRLPLLSFGWIVPWAALGMVVSWRREKQARLLAEFTLLYCFSVIAFFVFSRYRLQVAPALFVLSIHGAAWLWSAARAADWPKLAGGGLVVLLVALFSFHQWPGPGRSGGIAQSLTNKGALYVRQGDYQKALEAYREALAADPRSVNTLRDLGVLQMRLGRLDEARKYLQQAVQLNPNHQDAWLFLGKLLDQTNQSEEAKRAYREELRVQPGNPEAAFNLAMDEVRTGRAGEAIKIYEKMLTLNPNEPRIYHNLAVAYFSAGRLAEARQTARKSADLGLPLPPEFMARLEGSF